MSKNLCKIPKVGTVVHPAGSDKILYRVVETSDYGCNVVAINTEVTDIEGRKPRPLRYSEKRASLACHRDTGTLFDDRWQAWTIVKRGDNPKKNPNPKTYTVLERNGVLGSAHFRGAFETVEAAKEYAEQTAARSRAFMSYEIWEGTPKTAANIRKPVLVLERK